MTMMTPDQNAVSETINRLVVGRPAHALFFALLLDCVNEREMREIAAPLGVSTAIADALITDVLWTMTEDVTTPFPNAYGQLRAKIDRAFPGLTSR